MISQVSVQTAGQKRLAQLMAPVIDLAAENLLDLSDPEIEFVPENLRKGMTTVHHRLKNGVKALLELRTIYDDMIVCRVVAREYPWQQHEITHYQHLRMAWSQLERLRDLFEQQIMEFGEHHNAALELFSADDEMIDVGEYLKRSCQKPGGDARRRGRQLNRWYEVAPAAETSPIFNRMRVASRWPDAMPPFARHYDDVRGELLSEIDAQLDEIAAAIIDLLIDHGQSLGGLIERYNDMVRNFRILHEKQVR